MKTLIISIIYEEKSWQFTAECLKKTGREIIYVDRNGTGSLSRAYNQGIERVIDMINSKEIAFPEYLWMVSNVTFDETVLPELERLMDETKCAAIHPCFESDHEFCRCSDSPEVEEVPFVEFTAPIVRTEIMVQMLLNEQMPYWGHDLDWGHRVRKEGLKIGVAKNVKIGHTYIRNSKIEKVTQVRMMKRNNTNGQTRRELAKLYGKNWNEVLQYKGK